MTTFVCSDHHFGHQRILEFCSDSRPFSSVDEMNEAIIDVHNSVVNPEDKVWFLGDVVMGGVEKNIHHVGRLNGKKFLILGNHDNTRTMIPKYLEYFNKVFVMKEMGKNNKVLMSHYPVHPTQLEKRYGINIHGHLHDQVIDDPRYVNVCLDANGLMPIPLGEIIEEKADYL